MDTYVPFRADERTVIQDFDAIRLRLASPDDIHRWSYGEVTKPETINYRTQKPEKDGLFAEHIFGPTKDWECYCGKYKRVRYKGIICDKCGVEVTRAVVRRERMGHIDLASPVTHIWFLRSVPSKIGMMLDLSIQSLEKVVYFASFIITAVDESAKDETVRQISQELKAKRNQVLAETERLYQQWQSKKANSLALAKTETEKEKIETAAGKEKREIEKVQNEKMEELELAVEVAKTELKSLTLHSIISESSYQNLALKYGHVFEAGIGAEAIYELLKRLDLKKMSRELEKEAMESQGLKRRKVTRRLRLAKSFLKNSLRPEWMIMTAVPIIPPDIRPMVPLDGGRFATSDLNDLYRRVINRNNRLKRLQELAAPEVIQRNEKRMLQEAVDALIDNSARHGKTVTASTGQKRMLKSLADTLKGKQGRFRQNLLGKRIDYSGRSVIVVGPHLKLSQCGLPKQMALELFKPFVISKLIQMELVHNVRSANRYIEAGHDEVWSILEDVTKNSHVLLNRAPTLHRLGIQAFQPVLVEGKAIQLHPMVCTAFNADFDGDQMAVHVPLTEEAKREAAELMLSSKNLLKPATGEPIAVPSQDVVLGCYLMTTVLETDKPVKAYASPSEAIIAHHMGIVQYQTPIIVAVGGQRLETTVGRVLFNEILPEKLRFINKTMDKKELKNLAAYCLDIYGVEEGGKLLDALKDFAYAHFTTSGISWGAFDLPDIPGKVVIIKGGDEAVRQIQDQYEQGLLTPAERHVKIVETWTKVNDQISELARNALDKHNPVAYMVESGARGSLGQLNQMIGMKGLVLNPAGETIELPVKASYKEGYNVLEYFISTHGARKGLTDTALRTANAGYLTRRLVDVSQDVVVVEENCGTDNGFLVTRQESVAINETVAGRSFGRICWQDVVDGDGKIIIAKGEMIDADKLQLLKQLDLDSLLIRSVLYCESSRGLCQKCYGFDLGSNKMVALGTAVGIIAAQSIGEPGTQLTMRTFHHGGVAGADITQGLPRVEEIFEARTPKDKSLVADVDGQVSIGMEDDQQVVTLTYDETGEKSYHLPKDEETLVTVNDGQEVEMGNVIFMYKASGREVSTATAGVVHVTKSKITITGRGRRQRQYLVPSGLTLRVKDGDLVGSGQPLTNGSMDLQELFILKGKEAVVRYILQEIQFIYSLQGQKLNDKHIEVIVRQMFNWAYIEQEGDADLLPGEVVSRSQLT
ncbi:MAG: DNA-directed RNA polymerase subunit beta', partial [bacterium]